MSLEHSSALLCGPTSSGETFTVNLHKMLRKWEMHRLFYCKVRPKIQSALFVSYSIVICLPEWYYFVQIHDYKSQPLFTSIILMSHDLSCILSVIVFLISWHFPAILSVTADSNLILIISIYRLILLQEVGIPLHWPIMVRSVIFSPDRV